jgi:hypothetical protein
MTSVKIEVGDVVASMAALDKLSQRDLPPVAAWRLAKASRKLRVENDAYVAVHRTLVLKYGKQEGDVRWTVDAENLDKFNEEIQKVLSQKVTIEVPLISMELLGDGPLSPMELAPLWFLFEEEQNESNESSE